MKNPPVMTAGDTSTETLRGTAPAPFRIVAFRRVAYGSKSAEFSIETPLGTIEADLFTPSGRDPFVQARSVRDKFTGQWRRTVALDRTFAARVLNALGEPANGRRTKPQARPAAPSKTLLQSEARFEHALGELGNTEEPA